MLVEFVCGRQLNGGKKSVTDPRPRLIKHEGNRLRPYVDCCGKSWRDCTCVNRGYLTVGTGRNLDANGISAYESSILFENDLNRAIVLCRQNFPWFDRISDIRQEVIVNMCFNMGIGRLLGFHDMMAAIERGDYKEAAREMLDSKWAKQVGGRADELAAIMESDLEAV